MKRKLFVLSAVMVLVFAGCATIFHGSTDTVNFTSDPAGAVVMIDGVNMGKTPVMLELKSNKTYNIEYKLEGHGSKNYIINNKVGGGWVILDILGGLLPVVVDAATGNWYQLSTDRVNMVLEKE